MSSYIYAVEMRATFALRGILCTVKFKEQKIEPSPVLVYILF
jgi:hypothetical protein